MARAHRRLCRMLRSVEVVDRTWRPAGRQPSRGDDGPNSSQAVLPADAAYQGVDCAAARSSDSIVPPRAR